MNVFGVGMTPDIRTWDKAQRRVGSMLAIGVAAFFVLIGLITYAFARESAAPFYWALVVLLVVVLAYEVALLVLGLRAERDEGMGHVHAASSTVPHEPSYGPASKAPADSAWSRPEPAAAPAPEPESDDDVDTITLRCGDCSTVFDITDRGERPLYHNCPGCGAEGVLRDQPAPAKPKPAPAAAPAPTWAMPKQEPAQPTPAAAAPKRLKLRCGSCKEVFTLEDTGVRPLENRCPHCDRKGIIR